MPPAGALRLRRHPLASIPELRDGARTGAMTYPQHSARPLCSRNHSRRQLTRLSRFEDASSSRQIRTTAPFAKETYARNHSDLDLLLSTRQSDTTKKNNNFTSFAQCTSHRVHRPALRGTSTKRSQNKKVKHLSTQKIAVGRRENHISSQCLALVPPLLTAPHSLATFFSAR